MKRNIPRVALLALVSFMATLLPTVAVSAQPSTVNYQFLVGTGLLCGLDPSACPDITMADNGDTVEITGQGTLSMHRKSASGTGTFVHKDPDGNELGRGTWTAVSLLSFKSYGSGSVQGLPAELEGGLALIRVQLQPEGIPGTFNAVLQVDCLLGDKIPEGAIEGIRLNVQDLINFNKEVSGFTVFIRQ